MKMRAFCVVSLGLLIGACAQAPMQPSPGHLRSEDSVSSGTVPAPVQVSTILPKPRPALKPETYSVVVNNVSVNELLFALARDARLNIDIAPDIKGLVTLNAIDQTLPQLLSRIAKQADIRWELDGPNLVVMPDKPFLRTYKIDYLSMERRVETNVIASSDVGGSGGGASGGGAGGASGGSSGGGAGGTKIRISQSNLFWATLQQNVDDLLREEARINPERVQSLVGGASVTAPAQGTGAAGPASGPGTPGAGTAQASAAPAAQSASTSGQTAKFVIANPEAGVLLVRANSRIHEKVQEYLDQVLDRIKRQVLIEATIAEVQLSNQYQRGIDWSLIRQGAAGFTLNQSVQGTSTAAVNSSLLVMNYAASGVGATLRLLESFGNVRVLSSPKISVLNNQTAILKVVDNRVYFTITGQTSTTSTGPSLTTFTTTPNVVSVGFVMNVTPQISEAGSVLLNLRPSVTRILGYVNDPNPSLGAGVANRIPEIQTREMESMIRVDNGQVAVMGGLIQDSISDNEDTVPGLNEFPVIGAIFGHRNRGNAKTELVIFIRPLVVKDPSIDGDFRAFRSLVPGENFIGQPNPGKPAASGFARP
jgi:general secretion pathway protein D